MKINKIITILFLNLSLISFSNEKIKNKNYENINNKVKMYVMNNSYNAETGKEIYDLIHYFSENYRVEESIIAAIIKVESNFNHYVESPAGAIGLMQLMPGTANSLNVNPYDIFENLQGGIKYFKQCLKANNNDLALALSSYNAGLGNVNKYDSIPPFEETQNYVSKVLSIYNELTEKNYIFNRIEFENGLDDEEYKLEL